VDGDHGGVARLARLHVLEALREDLIQEPGTLWTGDLELAAPRAVGVEVVGQLQTAIIPRPRE
jgi:hypothetical protein